MTQWFTDKPQPLCLLACALSCAENNRIRVRLATSTGATTLSTVSISGVGALNRPSGLAFHPTTGALLVADTKNHRVISVVLTSPTAGSATVIANGVKGPHGLTVAPSGNILITADDDELVFMLRVSDSTLVRVAGGGSGGNMGYNSNGDGGAAANAQLLGAKDVAFAADGALLIPSHHSIRRVNLSSGLISTIVGPVDQPAASQISVPAPTGTIAVRATLNNAWGVVVDTWGNIFFVERDVPMIRRLSCTPN
jgi:DNA-binding beta-propeller fold protein YncE